MKRSKILSLVLLLTALFFIVPVSPTYDTQDIQAASKVKLNYTKLCLSPKQSFTLKISGTKKKVKWSSNKKSVATINQSGKVTAKKNGTATITAKVSGKKYKCKVTVMKAYAIAQKLAEAYDWQCEKIWNEGFCDIYHYIEDGTNAVGKKMDIKKTIKTVKKSLEKKNTWNDFVTSVQGKKYKKYKSTWKKLYKEMLKLEKCLDAGTPKAKSDFYFPYEKYAEYLDELWGYSINLVFN